MGAFLSAIVGFFSSSSSLLPLMGIGLAIVSALTLSECRDNRDMAQSLGQAAAANIASAATIAELTLDRQRLDKILLEHEEKYEAIQAKNAADRAKLDQARQTDAELDAWLADRLPAYVSGRLLKHPDGNAGANGQTDAAGRAAAANAGAAPGR